MTKLVRLKTRAGVRMRAGRRSVRPGGRVASAGRLQGRPVPRRGVLVSLQGYQRGFGWRTFKTVRATPRPLQAAATASSAPRPGHDASRFRATVREQAGYPWADRPLPAGQRQDPVNCGGRFSRKAFAPSA